MFAHPQPRLRHQCRAGNPVRAGFSS
jgi:hypothetical protein